MLIATDRDRDKFRLGLFDDPYVDPDEAERTCGSAEFRAAGARAQRRSAVLIANKGVLPLSGERRVYVDERPAVIPELVAACSAVVAVFGASDEAVLDVLFGRTEPEGRLPFELPSSMAAVREQLPDVPGDSRDPLFVFGHGLRYAA